MNGFRNWLRLLEDKQNKVNSVLDGMNLIMFFRKDGRLFGAPEESRIVFAKMKSPDEDSQWSKEAKFLAYDLAKALGGDPLQAVFGAQDISGIKMLDRDEIEQLLLQAPVGPTKCTAPKDSVGVIKIKEP